MPTYQIQARNASTDDSPAGAWSAHVGDQNEFDTRAEAEAAIVELRALGNEWATAEYRVVEVA